MDVCLLQILPKLSLSNVLCPHALFFHAHTQSVCTLVVFLFWTFLYLFMCKSSVTACSIFSVSGTHIHQKL
jgi:hypothetical protein